MNVGQRWKNIRYEAEVDPKFVEEIASIPAGQRLFDCIQCGTCSGTCPVSHYMDQTPRKIIAMIRAGFRREVLASVTTWLCASCYSCSVECPQEIKITDIMYALKRLAIQEGVYPRQFPISVLAREFYGFVLKTGRNNEARLTLRLFMKTNIFRLFGQTLLGLRLLRQGRMSFRADQIENKRQLRRIIKVLDERLAQKRLKTEAISAGGAK
jgi:heterodisulfide reductase subunit C